MTKCRRRHHELVEQQKQAPADAAIGRPPRLAGDPKIFLLKVFVTLVVKAHDEWQEWYKNAGAEDKQKVKGLGSEEYARTSLARILTTIRPPEGAEEAYYGGLAAQFTWKILMGGESGLIAIVPHTSDQEGVMHAFWQVTQVVCQGEKEEGKMPRTQDMRELQHMADHQGMWERL